MKRTALLFATIFTINLHAQIITLTSPNGGEIWAAGSVQTIAVTLTAGATINFAYSVDSGATFALLANQTCFTAGSCNYSWTIPNAPSTKCLVRVFKIAGGADEDTSNAVFTITGTSGIADGAINNKDYTAYHDAAGNELAVNWGIRTPEKITLYNIVGEAVTQVNTKNNASGGIKISTAQLPSGIYLVSMERNGTNSVKKVYIL